MKHATIVLVGLLSLASASATGQAWREGVSAQPQGDAIGHPKLAGVFQHYDSANQLLRMSDADYAVDPALLNRQGDVIRSLRQGQQVVIELSGYDSKGRDVIVGVLAK